MELNDRRLGFTKRRIELLNSLGIFSVGDLLSYYPLRYDVLNTEAVSSWKEKDRVTFEGAVAGRVNSVYVHGRNMSRFDVMTQSEIIHITIFNRPWAKSLKDGDLITVTGLCSGRNRVTALSYSTKPLAEQNAVETAAIPENEAKQKQLLRGLFNVRKPGPVTEEFLKIQDEYLQTELAEKGRIFPKTETRPLILLMILVSLQLIL